MHGEPTLPVPISPPAPAQPERGQQPGVLLVAGEGAGDLVVVPLVVLPWMGGAVMARRRCGLDRSLRPVG